MNWLLGYGLHSKDKNTKPFWNHYFLQVMIFNTSINVLKRIKDYKARSFIRTISGVWLQRLINTLNRGKVIKNAKWSSACAILIELIREKCTIKFRISATKLPQLKSAGSRVFKTPEVAFSRFTNISTSVDVTLVNKLILIQLIIEGVAFRILDELIS